MKTTHSGKLPFSTIFLLVIFFGLFPATVRAWGSKGHQIIARIADQRLSIRARKGVDDLLNGQSLESASTWADLIRSSQPFHFVSMPFDSNSYERERDCADGNCLIEKIKYYRDILQNPKETTAHRAEALKYVLHLVGDLHQPFHCIDRNGNNVRVIFDRKSTSLHRVWDSDMIDKGGTAEQYAKQLENTGREAQPSYNVSRGTIVDWALESHSLARRAYVEGGDLDDKYYQDNKGIVDGQLYRAGVRLAKILNDIFR